MLRPTFLLLIAVASLSSTSLARGDERVRVAVLPVVVFSGDGREYLQKGMADMLVSRIGRDARLAVIPVEDASAATVDVDAARKTALANDADFVVFGSFTRFGEGASLDLSCASVHDSESEPRKIYVHASDMGALIPLLDGVADRTSYAVLGSEPPGSGVASGPIAAPDANAAAVDEELRRAEANERSGPDLTDGPKSPSGTDSGASAPKRQAPGLPSDRDADLVR